MGEQIIGRRDVRLHVETTVGEWRHETVTLLQTVEAGPYGIDRWKVMLHGGAHSLGYLERLPHHRTYQIHGRLRYDNKPRTVWRSWRWDQSAHAWSGLYDDTRNEALAYLFRVGRNHLHLPGRRPRWVRCPLCQETTT